MRQEPRLFKYRVRHLGKIRQGGVVPEPAKLFARRAIAQFRLVAEREQRLLAIRGGARPRDGEDLLERQVGRLILARRMGERAVMADVPAKPGQRDKDL